MRSALRPSNSTNRIEAIDSLRGFALFGILIVNAAFFALPIGDSLGTTFDMEPGVDRWTALTIKLFAEMKFISIFSLLFGVGLAMQRERAITAGSSFLLFAYRRLAVLAIFGLFHALLLWYGDILFLYACMGAIVVLLLPFSPRILAIIGICLCIVTCLMMASFAFFSTFITALETIPMDDGWSLRGLDAIQASEYNQQHPIWKSAEIVAYGKGPFLDAFAFRSVTWGFYLAISLFTLCGYTAAMFCFGAALWKSGFVNGEGTGVRWRWPFLLLGMGIGVPLSLLSTILQDISSAGAAVAAASATQTLGAPLMALGMTSLFLLLGERGRLPLAGSFAAIGRMSLSAYLLQTFAFVLITNWWGFGMFGSFGRFKLFLISLAIYVAILLFCVVWQRFASIGPAEWLWRTIAYMKPPEWKTRPIRS